MSRLTRPTTLFTVVRMVQIRLPRTLVPVESPETSIEIACSTIVDSNVASATLWARVVCEGREVLIESNLPADLARPEPHAVHEYVELG